jgi:hypothetical protein
VRKIPLVERPFLLDDLGSPQDLMRGEGIELPEDPMVENHITKIRAVVLHDRDTYDKVGSYARNGVPSALTIFCL